MENSEITAERIISDYEYSGLWPRSFVTYEEGGGCAIGAMAVAQLLREGKEVPKDLLFYEAVGILGLSVRQQDKDVAMEAWKAAQELKSKYGYDKSNRRYH